MTGLPERPSEQHFEICEKALLNLGRMIDGNGYTVQQLRLLRHDTSVYGISAEISVDLSPVFSERCVRQIPDGIRMLPNREAVEAAILAWRGTVLEDPRTREAVLDALARLQGKGWGPQGNGKARLSVNLPAFNLALADICDKCKSARELACPACGGSGKTMRLFHASFEASCEFRFSLDGLPGEIQTLIREAGIGTLSSEGMAEIFFLDPVATQTGFSVPCAGFLPVGYAEFSLAGKPFPATVGGLNGKIVKIDPLLDKAIKPGIAALLKLSKGKFATGALIGTACKYRLLRQTLAGLCQRPAKSVYVSLVRNYPLLLSEKYARAAVKYGNLALFSLMEGPRWQGLALGTAGALLLSGCYFLLPVRSALASLMQGLGAGRHVLVADILVWAALYLMTIFSIRWMAARTLESFLPNYGEIENDELPSAGRQGLYALGTTFLVWIVLAALAEPRPLWFESLLNKIG